MRSPDTAYRAFTLEWHSGIATHRDCWFSQASTNTDTSGSATTFAAGELVQPAQVAPVTFPRSQFITQQRQLTVTPRIGRFYPQAYAWEALDCSRRDFRPFRLIAATPDTLTADLNHPLAAYPLRSIAAEHAPITPEIIKALTETGAGMQAPYSGVSTDYYASYPFTRADERADAQFYTTPRFVNHLDTTALAQVAAVYERLLRPGMHVLDLMTSHVSHLPDTLTDVAVTGLGMNPAELAANPRLQQHVVHDLNQNTQLPFADDSFDAVICTVSIEYLTQPLAVMHELARVTRSGGLVIMTFSTRWFPPKAITLWTEMHPFERQGLVLDYFLKTGRFSDLHTESVRGLPRPLNDPHRRETAVSDPVFAVWGTVTAFL